MIGFPVLCGNICLAFGLILIS